METWVIAILLVGCVVACPFWVRACLVNLRRWSGAGVVDQLTGNVSRDTQPVRFYYNVLMMMLGAILPIVVTIALAARLIIGR